MRKGSELLVSQTYDVWALGCIFLEALIWVTFGQDCLSEFRHAKQLPLPRDAENVLPRKMYQQAFHDGKDVAANVKQIQTRLRETISPADATSWKVLDLVEEMLVADPFKRLTSTVVCEMAQTIVGTSGQNCPAEDIDRESQNSRTLVDDQCGIDTAKVDMLAKEIDPMKGPYIPRVIAQVVPTPPSEVEHSQTRQKYISISLLKEYLNSHPEIYLQVVPPARVLKVFAILLIIGRDELISHFVERSLDDTRLPFDFEKDHQLSFLRTNNNLMHDWEDDVCKAQWKFFVPGLVFNGHSRFEKDCILPLHREANVVARAADAHVYKIKVDSEYDHLMEPRFAQVVSFEYVRVKSPLIIASILVRDLT